MSETSGVQIRQATKAGFIVCKYGGVADLSFPTSKTRRGRVQQGGEICPTIMSSNNNICKIERYEEMGYRLRSLTPRECWRLMGFNDADFDAAAKVNSNTQLYAQAGNAIVVNVLEAIFKQMIDTNKESRIERRETMKKLKCEICETEFEPTKTKHYIAVKGGVFALPTYYDAFVCPQCGGQIITKERYRTAEDYIGELEERLQDNGGEENNGDGAAAVEEPLFDCADESVKCSECPNKDACNEYINGGKETEKE